MQPLLSTLREALESRYQFKTQPLCWDACFSCSLYTKGSSATRVICLTLAVGLNIVLFFIPQSDLKFVKMSSPSKTDLPKVPTPLKNELAQFDSSKMKHAETQEKNQLPSKDDVQQEKVHNSILTGVEGFERSRLKSTETQEKSVLPNADDVVQEKIHQNIVSGVETFDKTALHHAETKEKAVLPSTEIIEQEKGHQKLVQGIENFDTSNLKHAETLEKNPLPTKEAIAMEKSAA